MMSQQSESTHYCRNCLHTDALRYFRAVTCSDGSVWHRCPACHGVVGIGVVTEDHARKVTDARAYYARPGADE